MINNELHKEPVALDTVVHRGLRLRTEFSAIERLAGFTSYMVTLAEFVDASHDFPIVFIKVDDSDDGKAQVAPIALFGLQQGENLFIDGDEWSADFLPAAFRSFPFTLARVTNSDQWAVVMDRSWKGFSETEGKPLFDDKGEATPLLADIHKFVTDLELDVERTRLGGQRLMELGLLTPMRFDATLPDGAKVSVDGFLTVDEKRLQELPDATVAELHRNGLLGLLHTHRISLSNMRRLLDRRLKKAAPAAANDAA